MSAEDLNMDGSVEVGEGTEENQEMKQDGGSADEANVTVKEANSTEKESETKPLLERSKDKEKTEEDNVKRQTSKGSEGQQGQSQGKKAQRTRRVKINPPPEGNTDKVQETNEQPKIKPGTIPKITLNDEKLKKENGAEDLEEIIDYYDEPSKLFKGLVWVYNGIWVTLQLLCSLLRVLILAALKCLGHASSVILFGVCVYLVGTYLMNHEDSNTRKTLRLEVRVEYVLRSSVWMFLPVILAYTVSYFRTHHGHGVFSRDSFEQVVLLFVNMLVMAVYLDGKDLYWLWAITLTFAVFRWCYWISSVFCSISYSRFFEKQALFLNLIMIGCNFTTIFGEDLGYLTQDEVPTPEPEPVSSGLYEWQYTSMCHMMETLFCAIDGNEHHRPKYASWS